ncbi:cold-shock protein [Haloferax sp. YSSS75]|uniref:cold-shock protein n=1 Tax=Haloferax sp. YSSS75 TaxID=3388564 RepID=UPI00398D6619
MKELRAENATGTVTMYKDSKGYGFLSTLDVKDGGTTDVFFHISDISGDNLEEGWRFEFDVYSTRKGFHAENLDIIKKGSEQVESSVDERFLRARDSEYDDTKYSGRTKKRKDEPNEENEDKDSKSPFKDDITGSKNDLL